ncbi:extracellular solute-binding protein [Mycolicibacterium sp. P1-18]|uniref:extracellular solute-binding protein n=1 Tax=Mycolicibacterium sp. P1-18 TaxID=2024615 RepID=UPI0011F3C113|nr:extracellular solute-binding protein [Mycolicibacterium sp. P1-18]KAA0099519.1 extracellular solute-binding protein [Mycolicibacterium sp. P1-18]
MNRTRVFRLGAAVAAASVALSLSACAPGPSGDTAAPSSTNQASKDISSAGPVTLTVWDQNTDGGISKAQDQLNAEFHEKYPNVTIQRTVESFSDLKTTLKLALSSNTPPDVVQANQGYPDMGAFVAAGMLRPMNDYATLYGWDGYYPKALLKQNSFSSDGKTWQGDTLFGVSQTGEVVGVYYNRQLLSSLGLQAPKTLSELNSAMAAAKAKGILPMAFGNLDKSPGIHLFGVVQAALAGAPAVDELVSGQGGAWTDDPSLKAAQQIAEWSKQGYLTPGTNGVSRDDAVAAFGKGGALFTLTGTWLQQTMQDDLGPNVGFQTLNSTDGSPATTGGQGLAWAITSKSAHPDVAAAYVDFITNAKAAQTLVDTGNLPTVLPADYQPQPGTVAADIATQYRDVQKANGEVPYLDYSTPTFYDTITAGMQELVGGQSDPQQFVDALQKDYASFLASKK